MTCDRRKHPLPPRLPGTALAQLVQHRDEHVAGAASTCPDGQGSWNAPDDKAVTPELFNPPSDPVQLFEVLVNCRHHPGRKIDAYRFQQRLRLDDVLIEARFHTLERHPFMSGVLVDKVHTVGTFSNDVRLMRLPDDPQNWEGLPGRGCRG